MAGRGGTLTGLQIRDLHVVRDDEPVLTGVDLDVAQGSTCAVLGLSGCGKTTLIQAIAGLLPAATGSIRFSGREITSEPPGRRDIGVVFQEPRLFPALNVLDNVAYGRRARGVSRRTRRAEARELLTAVGLDERSGDRPEQLSGGQAQRVALARALCAQPELLLLDEPLSAVDGSARASLRSLLTSLRQIAATTTVVVSHDLSDATALGDTIAVLAGGRIAQCGPPHLVIAEPASADVASLTGNPNAWQGIVNHRCVDLRGLEVPVCAPDGPGVFTARPEHIRLSDRGVTARVHMVEQRGSDIRVVAHSLIGAIEARLPVDALTRFIRPGDDIHVTFDPQNLWRFPPVSTGSGRTTNTPGPKRAPAHRPGTA